MPPKRKPEPAAILDMARGMEQDATKRNSLYDRLDRLYFQDRAAEQGPRPDDVKIITTPKATNAIDLVADLAAQQELSIRVPADGESAPAQVFADNCESWIRAWLSMNERVQHRNLVGECAWLGAQRAEVVLRTVFTEGLVKKKKDGYVIVSVPVLLQVRDPRYVYTLSGYTGLECVIERWTRLAGEVRRMYPEVLQDADVRDDMEIEWTEYWDDTYRCYFANDEAVTVNGQEVVPHRFGCVPYAIGRARATPERRDRVSQRPLLAGIETTLANLDTWMSILATAGWQSVTSAWIVKSDQYSADGKALDTSPGAINYFAREEAVEPLQRAPMPADFMRLGDEFKTDLQAGTFPLAMYGQVSGAMAGYAINMLTQSGRRVLLPIWKAIEMAYEGAIRNAVLICKNKVASLVGDKVPMMVVGQTEGSAEIRSRKVRRSLELDTTRIDESFDVSVTLGDPMPADEANNLRMAMESVKSGLLSEQTALDKFKIIGDPVAEMQRKGIEAMLKQLMGPELLKLAIERGYLPSKLELPEGFKVTPDGRFVPDWMMPEQPGPAVQQPAPEQAPPEQMPPEMMQQQPGQPTAADLQAIAGQPQALPDMGTLSGQAPPVPGMAY